MGRTAEALKVAGAVVPGCRYPSFPPSALQAVPLVCGCMLVKGIRRDLVTLCRFASWITSPIVTLLPPSSV